jgi:tetratricopeptide (TPR) repeat protein
MSLPPNNLLGWIGELLYAPIRAVLELGEWLGLSAKSSVRQDPDSPPRSSWNRILLGPFRLLHSMLNSLLHAFGRAESDQLVETQQRLQRPRRIRLLAAIPALIMGSIALCVAGYSVVFSRSIETRYLAKFETAITDGQASQATALGSHLIRKGTRSSPEASFQFCKHLATQKEMDRANAIIEVLAPNDAPGYPPAHEQRAIAYSNIMSMGATGDVMQPLLWHLNQAGDRNHEPLLLAWATYYRFTGQIDLCARALEAASILNPAHVFPTAEMYLAKGNTTNAERVLKYGRDTYRKRLADNTLSKPDRIQLARVQARLGSADEAETTLKAGLTLHPDDKELLQCMSALELARYEKSTIDKKPIEDRINQLIQATQAIEDPSVVFERMVQIYQESELPEHRTRVRQFLESALEKNEASAVTHFVLSIIAILEKQPDAAIRYLERSLELAPDQHLVKNNLAWLLTETSPPDLDRALELSQSAVESAPTIATYHDTLGSILLLRRDYPTAVTELERALGGMPANQKYKVHRKLAESYQALGNAELAAMHTQRSTPPNP